MCLRIRNYTYLLTYLYNQQQTETQPLISCSHSSNAWHLPKQYKEVPRCGKCSASPFYVVTGGRPQNIHATHSKGNHVTLHIRGVILIIWV